MRWKLVNNCAQFQDNCDITRPEVTFTTYTTLEDLINPRVNTFFSRNATVNCWLAFVKSLYTKENIFHNFNYFFPAFEGSPEREADFIRSLFEHIPEDKLWGLVFWTTGHWNSCVNPQFDIFTAGTFYGDLSGGFISAETNASFNGTLSTEQPQFWTKVTTATKKAAKSLEDLKAYGTCRTTPDNYRFGGLLGHLTLYLQDMRCFNTSVGSRIGNSVRPSEVLAGMAQQPDGVVSVVKAGVGSRATWSLWWKLPVNPNDRSSLYAVLSHSANVLDYLPFDKKLLEGPCTETRYGVELECCTDYNMRALIDAQEKLFFAGKQDGSIQGVGLLKVELVTLPITLSEHKVAWHKLFRVLDYSRFDTTVDTNNGMHVHVSKKVFGVNRSDDVHKSSHLRKFTWFISHPGHLPFILAISERKKNSLDAWAPIATYQGMTKGAAFNRAVGMAQQMRGSVNIPNGKPTVEVRLFKGIVSVATILKNLEFVDAVIEFTRNAGIREVGLKYFFSWLDKTPRNKYQFLKTFVKQVKTEELLDGAELFEAIFTEENPDRIITILKSKEFPLKNTHIALINKMKGRRTLIMDEGELKMNPQRKAKLATMDKAFENKYCRN